MLRENYHYYAFFIFMLSCLALQAKAQEKESNNQKTLITIEAENFIQQEKTEKRRWKVFTFSDTKGSISITASGKAYVQCLPDTRVTHSDSLIHGENFTNNAGEIAIISYQIFVTKAGRYYVWVRAFSTGTEDNGIHVGIDGKWVESGKRMQWCEGKNQWTWASKQRTEENHCGESYKIYLDIEKKGNHLLSFSMREDGFCMGKIILSMDKMYVPQ